MLRTMLSKENLDQVYDGGQDGSTDFPDEWKLRPYILRA
jgi:hypothetical protein